jgi:radical SAM protein with 4Fe4S-binding SPASM domain
MIDYHKLNLAYENKAFYSLQLEIGDVCHQGCSYCYMNALDTQTNSLSDQQIRSILKDAYQLGITAVEWLGGEPLLRDSIFEHMKLCADLGIRNNVWTGGLALKNKNILVNTSKYAKNGLISVHVSTINPELYQRLHPGHSQTELYQILHNIRELLDLDYPADQLLNSVTFTGLQSSTDMIETIDYFEEEFGIKTSLNVYHTYLRPSLTRDDLKQFIPSQEEVKKVYARYCEQWNVKDYPMNCVNKQYCSATLAVLCDGSVTPCATIREVGAPNIHTGKSFYDIVQKSGEHLVFAKFRDPKNLPPSCRRCDLSDSCFGCRSRSYAAGFGIYGKDPRCFRMHLLNNFGS